MEILITIAYFFLVRMVFVYYKLLKFTLRVFRTDTPGEALITLTRYLRPPDLTGAR